MSLGQGTVLSLSKFELFGIRDRVLSISLLLASVCGIPGITILLTLLASGFAYRSTSVAVIVTAVVSAFLAVITIFVLTRIITILLSSVTFSKKGRNILHVGAFLVLMAIGQLPNLLGNDYLELLLYGSASRGVLGMLAWTPFVAAFQLPFDAMAGQWLFVAIRVLVIAVTWAFCHWLCMWYLRKARQSSGSSTVATVSSAGGSSSGTSAGRSGITSAGASVSSESGGVSSAASGCAALSSGSASSTGDSASAGASSTVPASGSTATRFPQPARQTTHNTIHNKI